MSTCSECGEQYFGKECITCKHKKARAQYTQPREFRKPKKKSTFKQILITITIIGMVSISGYMTYTIIDLKNKNAELVKLTIQQSEMIQELETKNQILANDKTIPKKKLWDKPIKQKKQFVSNTVNKPKTQTTPKKYKSQNNYVKPKQQSKPTYTKNTSYKMYPKYTNEIKLKSDSKITKLRDNRLTSNAPIFGRYYGYGIGRANCNGKRNLYNVVDECSVQLGTILNNKVYLTKSETKKIKNFNHRTHMIECSYSKEHGLFHDCHVEMYRQRG